MQLAGVEVRRNTPVDRALVERERPDLVIVATGAEPYWPPFERGGELQVVDAWQVLRGEVRVGRSVLVTDWRGDWIGPGIAEKLVREGHQVRLAVNGTHCGESLPPCATSWPANCTAWVSRSRPTPAVRLRRYHGVHAAQRQRRGDAVRGGRYPGAMPGPPASGPPGRQPARPGGGVADRRLPGPAPPRRRSTKGSRPPGASERRGRGSSTGPGPAPRMPQTQPGPRRMPRPSPPDATDTPAAKRTSSAPASAACASAAADPGRAGRTERTHRRLHQPTGTQPGVSVDSGAVQHRPQPRRDHPVVLRQRGRGGPADAATWCGATRA